MNGKLSQFIADTAAAFRDDPGRARARFTSESSLGPAFHSQVRIRQHRLDVDEPPGIGGADAGPNPIELLLAALGTCQEITYRAWATAMDIDLRSVSVRVDGDIDLRGFFGVGEDARPGLEQIRVTVTLDSDAPAADIERLRAAVDAHCPVLDMLHNPVPVTIVPARDDDL